MNWNRKFRDIVLECGRYYYTHCSVQGLSYKDFVYKARVVGDYAYQVENKIRQDDIAYMKYSCPQAAKGNYCKHMAVLLMQKRSGRQIFVNIFVGV